MVGALGLLLDGLRLFHGAEVLEIGCGNAWLSGVLAGMGCRCVATDVSISALEIARRHLGAKREAGLIEPGSETDEIIRIVDMLPTFVELAGAELPQRWKIDGKSLLPLFKGETDESPVDTHYYYFQAHLQAVRDRRYKLILPRPARPPWQAGGRFNLGGQSVDITAIELYDLKHDIGEKTNVAAQHPEVVEHLLKKVEQARADIGDYNQKGANCRTDAHWAGPRSKWLAKHGIQAGSNE